MDETADTVEFLAASGTAHSWTDTLQVITGHLYYLFHLEDLIRAELAQSQSVLRSDPQVSVHNFFFTISPACVST